MLKKNKILSFLLVVIIFGFAAQVNATVYPVYDYTKGIGGSGADQGRSITTDSSGNVYTVGTFSDTVDFDPGAGTSNLTSAGGLDIFIQKLDSSGDFVWVKQIGSTGTDNEPLIALDSSGNIYVLGYFMATVDFDPGAGTSNLTSAGAHDIFIQKLDSSGDFVWVKQIGGTGDEYGVRIVFDSSSNIFILGGFNNTVDFDPGAGTSNLTSGGSVDPFLLKLDSSGDFVWVKQISGTGWGDWVNSVSLDSSGNIYIAGIFNNTADFDPGAGVHSVSATQGNTDAYILKLNSSGDFVWVNNFGSTEWDGAFSFVNSNDDLYLIGNFGGATPVDVESGAGVTNLTSAGGNDFFIQKLDSSGNQIWVKQIGGTGSEWVPYITSDSSSNIYISGVFQNTVDFDPGAGTYNLTSFGSDDSSILKLDSSGNFVYAKQFGGTGSDILNCISINSSNGYIYTTGWFANTADFDPDTGTANLTSSGSSDIFIFHLIPDIVAPTFTSVSSSNITNTGVTITWTTNEVSSSIVDYGTTSNYGSTTTETDTSTHVASHTVNLSNLTECTTYHYRVKSNDPSANLGTSSDSTFTTPGCSAVSVVLLQQMSDAMRSQESTVVLPPPTPTNTIVFCEGNNIFNPNTGERCTSNTNNTTSKFQFLKNLKYKDNNTDVKELQKFLNTHNFIISTTGAGSIGNETNYFGLATKNALIKFQKAFDIKPAVGYFGPLTRSKVNSL